MKQMSLEQELRSNAYPGRGIVIERSEDGSEAVTAYFIMGRSADSRDHVFTKGGGGIRIQALDPARLKDPSLIIYAPVKVLGNKTIVINGDQTDTIYEEMDHQMTFEQPPRSRGFKPDAPSYTPRIFGIIHIGSGGYNYATSILKSSNDSPDPYLHFTYAYEAPAAGEGRFIHTYVHDGDPLPSFEGEPKAVGISGNIDQLTDMIWSSLSQDNKISLFVRFISIASGAYEARIVDKNR